MGWGWGRYGGYGGYGRAAPKATKASAATLSTATLQRVLAQKAAEEEAAVRYQLQHQQRMRDAQAKAVEEAALEVQHGGKEQLAKWRVDNAERLQEERMAKMEAARKAAGEQAVVVEVAELRVELASLPQSRPSAMGQGGTHFQLNKAQTKAAFRLTDKDLDALPKIIATSGRSKTLFASAEIFAAVTRKEGKKQLRRYQAAYNPDLARRFVEDELSVLARKHPDLVERGRKEAVARLRQSDDAAIFAEKKAAEAIEAALAVCRRAGDKREEARSALLEVATREEVNAMGLVDLPTEDEDEDAAAEDADEDADEAKEDEDASEEDGAAEEYVVEEVLDSKQCGRKVLYLVKWEGFRDEADNTWEPESNLDDCPEKLEAYWKSSPESVGARQHAGELEQAKGSSRSPTSDPKQLEEPAGLRTAKRAGKEAATPVTASGPAKKKARVGESGESSAASSSSSAPPVAVGRPSRAAASAANGKMDALIKAGNSGIMVD